MSQKVVKRYDPIPTLRSFHGCEAPMRCIVGPVGSGKTTAASWELCYYLPKHIFETYGITQTRWVVLRNTYRELEDTTKKTIEYWFDWGNFKAQDNVLLLKFPKWSVEILFRSCDRPGDVAKFKSLELTGYWIDESIEVPDDVKLMLKNRIGRFPPKCPVRYGIETTNPPDVEESTYHQFKWLTDVPGPVSERVPLVGHYGFWQPPRENEANLRPRYYDDLIQDYLGNRDWIERYIMGKPGITVRGRQVFNNFNREMHVGKEPLQWPGKRFKMYAGWDNTGNCPAAVFGFIPTAGAFHVMREYHTDRMGIVDFANYVIQDRNARFPDAEWVDYGDPAGDAKFSRVGGGLTSNADMMRELGIDLMESEQNWEARRESVEFQLGRLVSGQPAFQIDPSCTRLINGFLGGYCYPEVGTKGYHRETPEKNKYSHVHDALQYLMAALLRNRSRAVGEQSEVSFIRRKPVKHETYREIYA